MNKIIFALPEELIHYINVNAIEQIDEEILINLEELYNNPPLLSKITQDEIVNFFWLDSYQKQWILKNRPISYNILEDSLIILDKEKLNLLKLFTTIKQKKFIKRKTNSFFLIRYYTKSKSKSESEFTNSNYNLASALNLKFKNYEIYLNTEKDRFESNIFDYYNFSFSINSKKLSLIGGAFNINWGQGLTAWNTYNFNYFIENPLSIKKTSKKASIHKSFSENNAFNGIAINYQNKNIINEFIVSNSYYDANIDSNNLITSILESGYHRTTLENKKKDKFNEKAIGNRFSIIKENLKLNFSSIYAKYNPQFSNTLKSDFYQQGDDNYILSSDFEYYYKNNIFFSEIAQSKNKNKAFIFGITKKIRNYKIALSIRKYDSKFFNIHSKALSYRDKNQNEQGFNIAASHNSKKSILSFYIDTYKQISPQDIFLTKSQIICVQYKLKQFIFNISYKEKLNYDKLSLQEIEYKTYLYKFSYTKKINNKIIFYNKFSYKHINNIKKYDGYLFHFKTIFLFNRYLNIINNTILFSSDNYNSRIYLYNNDIPTVWTLSSYYNRGFEINIYLKYKYNYIYYYLKTSFTKKSNEQKFYIGFLLKIIF